MKGFICGCAVMGSALLHGCATIVAGSSQELTFQTEPEGATVSVAGKALGRTPLTTEVSRDKNLSLTFEKEGYKPYTTQLSTTLNGWFWGNIVFGGFLGSTTDGVSGSIHEYSPSQYFVTLSPAAPYALQNNYAGDIKQIIMAFGPEMRVELARGGGGYVDELLVALGVTVDKKEQAVAALKNMAAATPDDLQFANKVIEVFGAAIQPAAPSRPPGPELDAPQDEAEQRGRMNSRLRAGTR